MYEDFEDRHARQLRRVMLVDGLFGISEEPPGQRAKLFNDIGIVRQSALSFCVGYL